MTVVRHMRASDDDRHRIAGVLGDAHAAGRLPPGEFFERLDAAFAAATWGELDDLVADLPVSGTDAGLPSSLTAPAGGSPGARRRLLVRAALTCAFLLASGLMLHVAAAAVWTGCLLALLVVLPLRPGHDRARGH